MKTHTDCHGLALSGANADAIDAYEQARFELRCLVGDPLASVDKALAAAPGMTMAHALKAWLYLLGTEPAGTPAARACHDAATALPANERERAHLHAVRLLTEGRWYAAARALEDLAIAYPLDLVALQVGHQLDFFTGDSRMLRDRIARALPHWQRGMPGRHAVLGMHAFGLEETADYAQAERQGRAAVELEPRDSWGWHAVAHVLEMRNQPREGIEWLRPHAATWSHQSFLAVHNWWHLALFHLELDETDEVLRLFDEAVVGAGSSLVLELIDASAMLWRLQLRGIDVGDRWQPVAERWAGVGGAGQYVFNDVHALMAYIGAGRTNDQRAVIEAQHMALEAGSDNAGFTRDVGLPVSQALVAFGEGQHALCCELLRNVRHRTHRFGGSHAQRDLIDLTLIESALRGGQRELASALTSERAALRPNSPLVKRYAARSAVERLAA